MDEWVLWMVAAGLLAVGEMFTLGFFAGPIAIAAAVAAIVALAGGGVALQWIVFIAASGASLLLL
ncbi:MAG: NfeD family protein, partial [Thermoleophilaceae bacterium]